MIESQEKKLVRVELAVPLQGSKVFLRVFLTLDCRILDCMWMLFVAKDRDLRCQ